MATGRVWAEFFHTRARPASLDPRLEPGPIRKWIFLRGPDPPRGLHGPRWATVLQGPFCGPKKKKFLPDIDFLSNQQIGTRIIKITLKLENTNLIL